jgi:hypothetical protein
MQAKISPSSMSQVAGRDALYDAPEPRFRLWLIDVTKNLLRRESGKRKIWWNLCRILAELLQQQEKADNERSLQ